MKKTLTLILTLSMTLILAACGNNTEATVSTDAASGETEIITSTDTVESTDMPNEESESYTVPSPFANVAVGDSITFGSYEQDADTTDGQEAIEWDVIAEEDEKVLLLSKYVLDCQPYNTGDAESTWENCTLRTWLNDGFFNSAFTAEEQDFIEPSVLVNENAPDGGNGTTDQIFLLSLDEVRNYFATSSVWSFQGQEFNADSIEALVCGSPDLVCLPTKYAFTQGCLTYFSNTEGDYPFRTGHADDGSEYESALSCEWFLRTPGYGDASFVVVDGGGGINKIQYSYYYDDRAVRPAMWVSR